MQTPHESWTGRRVTLMGLGLFGGGVAVARFLAGRGANVTVTDLRGASDLRESLESLGDVPDLRYHLGKHHETDFTETDLLVVNPAVKPGNHFVSLAQSADVPTTSELRLFWPRCRAKIIGVTGSNGKSTTAVLIADMLKSAGRRVWLGGNMGVSLLGQLDDIADDDWVVLELSSFQLADLNADRLSPHVAVITNFAPNHLDWHGTLAEYTSAKQTLLNWQRSTDMAVRFREEPVADWPTAARLVWVDGDVLPDLSGCSALRHHEGQKNAALAATTALALGVDPTAIAAALCSFIGLPHRLQTVGQRDGVTFINDSAATTPESTIAALRSFDHPVILIAGGTEKGCDLDTLADAICTHAKQALLIGNVADTLGDRLQRSADRLRSAGHAIALDQHSVYADLSTATTAALDMAQPGDTVLFSPAFSSADQFRHFAERGDAFVSLIDA